MKLSINTFPIVNRFGEEKALEMIKNAGFDGVDYSLCELKEDILDENYIMRAKNTKKLLDKFGFFCEQTHAPFKLTYTEELSEKTENYLKVIRSIEYSAIIGAKSICIHALKIPANEDFTKINYAYYKSLEPYAKKFGIKIAVENLTNSIFWTADKLCNFIKLLDSNVFCGLVDVGHSAITGTAPEKFISEMAKGMLSYVHLHDTDGSLDRHWIPFLGVHNWENIVKALVDYGFTGEMNLEVIHSYDYLPNSLMQDALNFTCSAGRKLIEMAEDYKSKK